ncbi:hypothetical protein GSI_04503 [Ganoderma sinense ZZ0214-1]|uniref:Uncharacterized protein n=1 Tax=Ganoderma sinense ZZ0214-1 TaxID=1077348 RepID=A0A2G8SH07_9APHY|nr:hypothetical protein GSI_04503 [Ganoderma sinense ZZ0214-1]
MQVRKSGEKMDRSSIKQAGIQLGAAFRFKLEGDLLDNRDKPWGRIEELAEGPQLLVRLDNDTAEKMDSRTR